MRGAGLISKEKLKQYVVSNGDSLSAVIPSAELIPIFEPKDVVITEKQDLHIKQQFHEIMSKIINNIE
jgi:hypothetical protein